MENLAWSQGMKPQRSLKHNNPALCVHNTQQHPPIATQSIATQSIATQPTAAAPIATQAAKQPISKQPATIKEIEKLPGDYTLHRNTFRATSNKREASNNKLSERYMVSRACGNPFLTHLNYIDDILIQEQYLTPKNSNMENEYNE